MRRAANFSIFYIVSMSGVQPAPSQSTVVAERPRDVGRMVMPRLRQTPVQGFGNQRVSIRSDRLVKSEAAGLTHVSVDNATVEMLASAQPPRAGRHLHDHLRHATEEDLVEVLRCRAARLATVVCHLWPCVCVLDWISKK